MSDPAPQPLQLVCDELAVTLNDVRADLEQYADGEAGNAPLERCAALLHSARGVLQITETYGASLLAEEMEKACRYLARSRRDGQPDDSIEALLRAAVQLPAYIERIRNGGRDVPLILLPLLNDLRATRGKPLLSESTLLLLNLAPGGLARTGAQAAPQPSGEDIAALGKRLRPRFQLALLGWIRGESAGQALPQLRHVADRLEAAAAVEVVHQLWWVLGGVLEALAEQGLDASVSIKRLVGQADREIKRLHTLGEQRFAAQPPVELVNNLLYYVARARSSGPRVAAIREAFNLSGLIPGDEQVEIARQNLAAPSVKLMQTVAGAIREDLSRVKDVLDIYVRTGMERVEELAPQVDLLKKIGDTLGVLGLGELREVVRTRREELEELVAGTRPADENTLVGMAVALLGVEDRLEHQLIGLISPTEEAGGAPTEPPAAIDGDQVLVTQVVMRECLANLARVKEAISLVTERAGDGAALDAVPALLRGITAALMILEKDRAARIAEGIAAAVSEAVRDGATPDGRVHLDRLADAIVSLEYYLETLHAGRKEPFYMLDNAAHCLDALTLAATQQLVPLPEPAGGQRGLAAQLPATVVVPRPGPSADRPVVAAGPDDIDPDILELFIEEAREAIESIRARFPAWEVDEGDRDALFTVRRAFHTLKGSGRMVGAAMIGEYCWSIEHLLNRLIDGPVVRTPELLAFMRRAITAVAELLEQLEVGSPPASDIAGLMAEAEALATSRAADVGEGADGAEATEVLPAFEIAAALAPARAAPPEPAPAPPAEAVAESPAPAMDPVLLDILSREVAAHLAVIRDYAAGAAFGVSEALPEAVFRAGHTLLGSLTMAGAGPAVSVAEPLNDLLSVLYESRQLVESDVLLACRESADVVAAVLEHLRDLAVPLPGTSALTDRLRTLGADAAARSATLAGEAADTGTVSMQIPVLADIDVSVEDSSVEPEAEPEPMLDFEPMPEPEAEAEPRSELAAEAATPTADVEPWQTPMAPAAWPAETGSETALSVLLTHAVPGIPAGTVTPYDAEVAGIFAEEAAELLESADQALARLSTGTSEKQVLAELQRGLHTLKGGARMAGLFVMGDLSHELETLLNRVGDGAVPSGVSTWGLVQAVLDELHSLRDQIPAGGVAVPSAELLGRLAAALHGEVPPAGLEPAADLPLPVAAGPPAEVVALPGMEPDGVWQPVPEAAEPPADLAAPVLAAADGVPEADFPPALPALERLGELARALEAPPAPESLTAAEPEAERTPPARDVRGPEPRDFARVESGLLEQLLNGAGEISIANSRLNQQLSLIQFNLEELNQTVVRLRDQLRKLEMETEAQILHRHQTDASRDADFDPLELDRYSSIQQLSRGLAETASDVSSLKDLLQNLSADTEAMLIQQSRTTTELQDGLMRTRMVPFHQHGSRLARLVRQTAKDTGKLAELLIDGSGELDRQVLEKMLPPFEHMLRNAVVHGIETPMERETSGKPAAGTIRIAIRREGAEVVIEIADDGRGLDIVAIRRKAVELGFVGRDTPLTDEEAMQFILRSGFSTADQLTQAAGRGIGMDVVANQVAKLGGALSIASRRGHGTTFTLRLPFTLAVTQALIIRAGSELYALPLPTVEGIIRISRKEFEERMAQPEPAIEYGGQRYLFRHLGQFLGLGSSRVPDQPERVSIILVRAGENSTALITDEMLDSREIVVKPVGAQLATVRGISGATILGDGQIVVILDVGALVRTARPGPATPPPAEPEIGKPVALVVDDSITMRRVTQRLLERNGFRVLTAKDGIEAISVLQDHRPDIILLDVEMPRMDGYEFARHVRNNPDTAALPIIMVTSRVSEKHRARAIEIGVNDYLGKPYQERELLEAVHHQLTPA